jgi:hypothetical protein
MARTSATTPGETKATLHPDGDFLCAIVGVSIEAAGAAWKLRVSLLTSEGTATVDVMGATDKGKGPWIARVASMVAGAVASSLPPVDGDKQPAEDFDWEAEGDLRAVMLGGLCWLTIGHEAGAEKNNGGWWPDKQTVYWPAIARAADEDVRTFRATKAWKAVAPTIRTQRDTAIAEWRNGLERAANGGSATDASDDAVPF